MTKHKYIKMEYIILASTLIFNLAFAPLALAEESASIAPKTATPNSSADKNQGTITEQGIIKMPLAAGVSLDDAVQSMKIRANNLNIKMVGDLPLSKQIQAMGHGVPPY